MEYGTREAAGLETAAAEASNDGSCSVGDVEGGGRTSPSSGCDSNSSEDSTVTTSDWPIDNNLALLAAGLQLQQPLPSSTALLLNSLYSLHALHSQRLWYNHDNRTSDDEPKDQQQDNEKEEASNAAELPAMSSWMLSAYTSMLGRWSAVAASAAAAFEPDTDTESPSSERSSAHPNDFRSRESSPSCSSLQKGSPTKRKRSRPAASANKRAKKKRTSEPQRKQEASTSSATTTTTTVAAAATATTATTSAGTAGSAGGASGRKRGLQALQRVRYRYEREEYRCGLCSYACTIEKAFERHLRDHARGTAHESRVSCAVCGADRASELDLSKHMRRHRDNRYFCCDICIFRTVQLKKLIQHRRMHTGEKPHLCPHCSYRSARRDNLRSHVRRVHKKENLYQDTFSPRAPNFLKQTDLEDDEPRSPLDQSNNSEPRSPEPETTSEALACVNPDRL